MKAGEFKAWLLAHLDLDTWFTAETLRRRFAGLQVPDGLTPELAIAAMLRLGLVETHTISGQPWHCLPAWKPWMDKAKTPNQQHNGS